MEDNRLERIKDSLKKIDNLMKELRNLPKGEQVQKYFREEDGIYELAVTQVPTPLPNNVISLSAQRMKRVVKEMDSFDFDKIQSDNAKKKQRQQEEKKRRNASVLMDYKLNKK